jgi:hypothetical protein
MISRLPKSEVPFKQIIQTTNPETPQWMVDAFMGEPMENKSLADRLFEASALAALLEEEILDKVLVILGVKPEDTDNWPFYDFGWDWYDSSFELYGCAEGFSLSPEQYEQIKALGFSHGWCNYADGSECFGTGKRETKGEPRVRGDEERGSRETAKMARLGRAIDPGRAKLVTTAQENYDWASAKPPQYNAWPAAVHRLEALARTVLFIVPKPGA